MRKLSIFVQLDPPSTHPYWLIETYPSVDGPRTRVCGAHYKTETEARFRREELLAPFKDEKEPKK